MGFLVNSYLWFFDHDKSLAYSVAMKARVKRSDLQRDFLKFTAQNIHQDLKKNHPKLLDKFFVDAKDRQYQFCERNPAVC